MDLKDELDSFEINKLLESLYLPKLKYDLDSVPIENELFADYQANVEQNLPLLFDFVQQQKQFINENKELNSSLILLLCELASNSIFRIKNERLLLNVRRLLEEQKDLRKDVESLLFDYYRDKLKKDVWKVQLGPVHGFEYFLDFFFNGKNRVFGTFKGNWLNFSLAVALNVRDCHENTYKQLGIKIFLNILQNACSEDIRKQNLHSVIYDSVLKDVHSMDEVQAVSNIWNCVLLCLDFFQNIDSLSWNQVDDLVEILLRYIPLTNNAAISSCMLGYLTKLCFYFAINRTEISESIGTECLAAAQFEDCLNSCATNTSYTIFRWAKSILESIIFECHKLMPDVNACLQLLTAMFKCYLVAILPIPVQIVEPHLISFYDKFTAVLMEIIVVHKKHEAVIEQTKCIINTFIWQLNRSNCVETNSGLASYLVAFKKLRRNEIFC